jgi:hypothetical protein
MQELVLNFARIKSVNFVKRELQAQGKVQYVVEN